MTLRPAYHSARHGVLHIISPSRLTARRAFFLIDQEGIVRGKWLSEIQGALYPSDPILEKVREITGKPWRVLAAKSSKGLHSS